MMGSKDTGNRRGLFLCTVLAGALATAGCDPDLLDTEPQDRYTAERFWENENALNGR
jgi:hypothetical protein